MKTRTGKIACLPHPIREQINRRLQNNERGKSIVKWLNTLPEVKTVLKAEFKGSPISPQNLSEWKQGGYGDWQVRQEVLQLAENLDDENSFGHQVLAGAFSEKLARWLILRFAAAAQTLAVSEPNPRLQRLRLRELCADVARLRRGDLYAEHLRIQRDWLALEQTNAGHLKEKQFWAWTERPDIKEKLHPQQQGGLTDEAIREVEEKFLGMTDEPFESIGMLMRSNRLAKEAEEAEAAAATDNVPAQTGDQPPSDQIKPNQT